MKTEVAFRDSLWVNCTPGLRQPTSAQLHQEGGKRCQAARGQIYEGVSALSSRSVEAVRQHLGAVEGVRCPSAAVCLARSIGADGRGRRPPSRWSMVRAARVLEPGFRVSGLSVAAALDRVLGDRPGPCFITVDHGTEFQSQALVNWPIAAVCKRTSSGQRNPWKMPALNRLMAD